jgi:hypothetical protein
MLQPVVHRAQPRGSLRSASHHARHTRNKPVAPAPPSWLPSSSGISPWVGLSWTGAKRPRIRQLTRPHPHLPPSPASPGPPTALSAYPFSRCILRTNTLVPLEHDRRRPEPPQPVPRPWHQLADSAGRWAAADAASPVRFFSWKCTSVEAIPCDLPAPVPGPRSPLSAKSNFLIIARNMSPRAAWTLWAGTGTKNGAPLQPQSQEAIPRWVR